MVSRAGRAHARAREPRRRKAEGRSEGAAGLGPAAKEAAKGVDRRGVFDAQVSSKDKVPLSALLKAKGEILVPVLGGAEAKDGQLRFVKFEQMKNELETVTGETRRGGAGEAADRGAPQTPPTEKRRAQAAPHAREQEQRRRQQQRQRRRQQQQQQQQPSPRRPTGLGSMSTALRNL